MSHIKSSSEISDTFCILPWIHVSTKTNGEMRLCCTTCASSAGKTNIKDFGGKLGVHRTDDGKPANLNSTSLLTGWNNQYVRNVRLQMLNGEKPLSCAKCFKEEDHGMRSKRQWETEYWARRIDLNDLISETRADGTIPEKIRYFDLRLGHKCNLRCTMCSPHDSSGWISDWDLLYPQLENQNLKELLIWRDRGTEDNASYDWYKNPQFWSEFETQIPHIRQIYFAGGEPLLIDEHYQLLEKVITLGHAGKIELRYNSNGTVLPDKVLALWEHFKKVRFGLSLDCFGEKNTYIRYPAHWPTIERNLKKLDETPDNIEVNLACAVQVLNIFYLPDFIQWKLSQNFKKINHWPNGAGLLNFHLVYHPAFLNVRILPPHIKAVIAEKYGAFESWLSVNYRHDSEFMESPYGIKRLQGLVKFMNAEDWSNRLPEFNEYITKLDKLRGTDIKKFLPEFYSLFDK